ARGPIQHNSATYKKDPAEDHGATVAEELIGQPAAEERAGVDEHDVVGIKRRSLRGRKAESFVRIAQVKCEHPANRVEAEALPHLSGKQYIKPARVFFEVARYRLDHVRRM